MELDEEIRRWEQEEINLNIAIKNEQISQMMSVEQAQKDIRGVIDAEYLENWERLAFVQRWN